MTSSRDGDAVLIDTGLGIGSMKTVTDGLTDLPVSVITTHVRHEAFKNILCP